MRLKLSLMLAAALVSATPGPALAQYTLNVRDADIRAFIQDAARITGRTFVIDGRHAVQGGQAPEVFAQALRQAVAGSAAAAAAGEACDPDGCSV